VPAQDRDRGAQEAVPSSSAPADEEGEGAHDEGLRGDAPPESAEASGDKDKGKADGKAAKRGAAAFSEQVRAAREQAVRGADADLLAKALASKAAKHDNMGPQRGT